MWHILLGMLSSILRIIESYFSRHGSAGVIILCDFKSLTRPWFFDCSAGRFDSVAIAETPSLWKHVHSLSIKPWMHFSWKMLFQQIDVLFSMTFICLKVCGHPVQNFYWSGFLSWAGRWQIPMEQAINAAVDWTEGMQFVEISFINSKCCWLIAVPAAIHWMFMLARSLWNDFCKLLGLCRWSLLFFLWSKAISYWFTLCNFTFVMGWDLDEDCLLYMH